MFKGILLNGTTVSSRFDSADLRFQRTSGAHRIASHLRNHGWNIEVLDFCGHLSQQQIEDFLLTRIDKNTKFIGFSKLFSEWTEKDENITAFIKAINPDICTIYGSQVHQIENHYKGKLLDYCISGYGENAILELLKYLFSNGAEPKFTDYKNYKLLNGNKDYPAAPLSDPCIIYENRDFIHPSEVLSIETSRGCKFKCAFCNFPFLGVRDDWTRNASSFELQIKDIYDRFGATHYIVTDETFNDNVPKMRKYADVVEKLSFTPYFSGFVRADLLVQRKYDIEELARMNFVGQYYGIETFNHKSAKLIGKGLNPEILKPKLLEAQNYFTKQFGNYYNSTLSMIIGLPEDTEEDIFNDVQWIKNNWKLTTNYFVLEIPVKNETNTESIFTRNFEKYGYEVMTDEEIELYYKKTKFEKYIYGMRGPNQQVFWKNKHMNLFRANELYEDITSNHIIQRACNFYRFGRYYKFGHNGEIEKYYSKKIDYVLRKI